jgi:hypothetical protein
MCAEAQDVTSCNSLEWCYASRIRMLPDNLPFLPDNNP